jgi:HEPN domain-containing protein
MPPKNSMVREWLAHAQRDLRSARRLLEEPPEIETACFRCQQAVKKSLKAMLALNDQRPPHTHKLSDLFGLCERWMPGIAAHEADCGWLTGCAVESRYPDNKVKLTHETVTRGLAAAEMVVALGLHNMPAEVRP